MAIIKLNNNALTSVTELPSGLGGDPDVKVDVARLGLRVFANQNLAKQNSNSASFDVFQDSTGITNLTNTGRDDNEFVSSTSVSADPNIKGLWTTEIDNATAVHGSPIADKTGTLQIYTSNNSTSVVSSGTTGQTLGSKSIRTAGFDPGTNNRGFMIQEVSGQTSDLNFGTGAFTIEFFAKVLNTSNDNGVHQYFFDWSEESDTSDRIALAPIHQSTASGAYMGSYISGDVAWDYFGTSAFKHIAYVRNSSGNNSIFANGSRLATGTNSDSLDFTDSSKLGLGQKHDGAGASYIYINNIRISNIARYDPTASSLTIPTSVFTDTTSTFNASGSFEGATITAGSSTNKMGAVITYQDHSGTNALNSDLVLKLSADNGSNYSTATLTALPDFSSGVKCCSVADLSVTAGTQLKYKIEFANQSSGSKECRVTGVSLQY